MLRLEDRIEHVISGDPELTRIDLALVQFGVLGHLKSRVDVGEYGAEYGADHVAVPIYLI